MHTHTHIHAHTVIFRVHILTYMPVTYSTHTYKELYISSSICVLNHLNVTYLLLVSDTEEPYAGAC